MWVYRIKPRYKQFLQENYKVTYVQQWLRRNCYGIRFSVNTQSAIFRLLSHGEDLAPDNLIDCNVIGVLASLCGVAPTELVEIVPDFEGLVGLHPPGYSPEQAGERLLELWRRGDLNLYEILGEPLPEKAKKSPDS